MEEKYGYFPVVISAPSGGGKSTVKNYLLKKDERFAFSVTCTTREKRPGEREGRDYFFVSEQEFSSLIKRKELIEWAEVHGCLYGTPKKSVLRLLKEGKIPLMTIDVKGARSVKKIFKDAVSIFLLPPDPDTMVGRLKKRGEKSESVSVRMKTAVSELKEAVKFDYLVVNDRLEKAVADIIGIINSEEKKNFRRKNFIDEFAEKMSRLKID